MVYNFVVVYNIVLHLTPFFGKNIDRWAYGGGGGTQNPGVGGAEK